jgi:hypothetical protein
MHIVCIARWGYNIQSMIQISKGRIETWILLKGTEGEELEWVYQHSCSQAKCTRNCWTTNSQYRCNVDPNEWPSHKRIGCRCLQILILPGQHAVYEVYHTSNYTNSMSTKQSFSIAEILTVISSWNARLLQRLSYYGFLILLLMKNV